MGIPPFDQKNHKFFFSIGPILFVIEHFIASMPVTNN